ncbi:MAG: inosine/xanthosine triphosphatase [Candidatus Micrarchaeota archaeon]|nr:inosine/xanthosine triphosphatase [Candidatus Micrarchaeota archaeon]
MYDKVVVGGTFDTIHKGHRSLLSTALKAGKFVWIGLTSDSFAKTKKIYKPRPYAMRKKQLEKFFGGNVTRVRITPLNDPYGESSTAKCVGAIVVSEETEPIAKKINEIRAKRKLKSLNVIVVPIEYGEDLKRIACERIRRGLIDGEGRRLKPILLAVGTTNPSKHKGLAKGAGKYFRKFEIRGMKVRSLVSGQPFNAETMRGAVNRAINAYGRIRGASFGVGLESGVFISEGKGYDTMCCCVFDGSERHFGFSMGFEIPDSIMLDLEKGRTLSEIFGKLAGQPDIGKKKGAIGYLSEYRLKREEMAEQAFSCAMIPFVKRRLY